MICPGCEKKMREENKKLKWFDCDVCEVYFTDGDWEVEPDESGEAQFYSKDRNEVKRFLKLRSFE